MFLSSCTSKKSVVGLYGKCEKNYLGCTQIELKPDNTFEYYIYMDVGGEAILKGTWIITGHNNIFLYTHNQPKNPKIKYSGITDNKINDKIIIKVSDSEGPLSGVSVSINNNKEWIYANENGIVEFPIQEINSISYFYFDQSETVKVEHPDYNYFTVTTKDIDIHVVPQYLTNEKLIHRKNHLIFNNDIEETMFTLKKNKK